MRQPARFRVSALEPALWAGAVLSAGVGLLFYLATAKSIDADTTRRFQNLSRNAQYALNVRLRHYADVLRGSASMFQTNDALTRAKFHDYVAGLALDQHFPGIETINFARYVRREELPAFTAALSAELARDKLKDGYPLLSMAPPGPDKPDYSLLVYIEPIDRWSTKFGYDLQSREPVARALAASRDSGAITTSGLPLPVLAGPNRTGMGMRLPIYRSGMPLATVAQRRAAYLGSIGVGFSVQRLVQGVLDELPLPEMRLTLLDGASGNILFDSAATEREPRPRLARPDGATFLAEQPLDFNGHPWIARFSTHKGAMLSDFDTWFPWLASLAGFVVTLLLYALFHTLASSRLRALRMARAMTRELRASQAKLQESHDHLRRLAAHADQIKEEERKRIAREIHDDLGQNLLALRIEADLLATRTAARHPRLHERARATLRQIDATIRSVRQIINDLRPNVLDLGLNAAVDWLIADFRRRTGIQCELIETHKDIQLADNHATAFFRILQESLNNIARHAQASYVRVDLLLREGELAMNVADNGVGLAATSQARTESFGLVGIEERVRILGGRFAIHSAPGRGTTVSVAVQVEPLPPPTSPWTEVAAAA